MASALGTFSIRVYKVLVNSRSTIILSKIKKIVHKEKKYHHCKTMTIGGYIVFLVFPKFETPLQYETDAVAVESDRRKKERNHAHESPKMHVNKKY